MFRRSLIFAALLFATIVGSPQTSQALDLSGTWTGQWEDFNTGHSGPLRATFVKLTDGNYEVNFSGRFFKIIPFRYTVVLNAVEKDGKVHLSGTSNVSRRRGTFTYTAEATDTNFVSSFVSCKDNGQFRLDRCSYAEPSCCGK